MPTVAGPYGMEAVQNMTSGSTNLAVSQYLIDPLWVHPIYTGDVARQTATGYVEKDFGSLIAPAVGTTLTLNAPIGVFTGFEFTSLVTKQRVQSSFYPGAASVLTTDPIWGQVNDDPFLTYMIQTSTAITTFAAAISMIGNNAGLTIALGTPNYGRSRSSLAIQATPTTATLPLRIMDIARGSANPYPTATSPQFMNVLVKFNTHFYLNPTGI